MKIALIRQRYVAHGGAERYLDLLIAELARRSHEIHLFTHRWEGAASPQVVLHRVPMLRPFSFLRALSFAFFCKRALAQAGCDVVFSLERTLRQDIYRAGDGCHREWLAQRRRFLNPAGRAAILFNPLHVALLWLERRTFSPARTGLIIANSFRGKEEITRHYGFPADRVHVVHNGVDCARFTPAVEGPGGSRFVLLFVGTGFERKGLEFAVRALSRLPDNVALRVVGKGDAGRYQKLARRLGVLSRVTFSGRAEDMPAVYRCGDLLVLPAIYEPFANVCLEAMASGLPVVTSRINGASDVIRQGENGAVVEDPADVEALAEAIRPFLDREALKVASLRARSTAETLSISANVERTLELLHAARSARPNRI